MLSRKKVIYLIGPRFTVFGHSKLTLNSLAKKYDVECVSEGPKIQSPNFTHVPLRWFSREPRPLKDVFLFFELLYQIRRSRCEFVILSTPKIAFFGAIACVLLNKRYLYIHRGAVYQNFKRFKRKFYRRLDFFVIKNAAKTYFISRSLFRFVSRELRLRNMLYGRNFSSAQGFEEAYFDKKLCEASLRARQGQRQLTVGFIGRFCSDKGFDVILSLVDQASELDHIRFIIKGREDEGFRISDRFLKNPKVTWLPWDDQIIDFFYKIDLLLFPSIREGFGNVCMQAAASGVLTLGIDGPGVRDAVIDGKTGFLVTDAAEFERKALTLFSHPENLTDFEARKLCLEIGHATFGSEKILEEFMSFVTEVESK